MFNAKFHRGVIQFLFQLEMFFNFREIQIGNDRKVQYVQILFLHFYLILFFSLDISSHIKKNKFTEIFINIPFSFNIIKKKKIGEIIIYISS